MKIDLKPNKNYLETEKANFVIVLNDFIDGTNIGEKQEHAGRPRANIKDILKSFLMMSYHNFSTRRGCSEILNFYYQGFITHIPKRSTIAKYMLDEKIKEILQELISLSARTFMDVEDTVVFDSTSYSHFIRLCGSHRRKLKGAVKLPPLRKTRKLHIACFRKSKMIICARTSLGTIHDNNFFKEMLEDILNKGFTIKTLLGDSAYSSKKNFALCEDLDIKNVFINFRKNTSMKNPQSFSWKKGFKLFNQPEIWHETYRFRVLVESLFSGMKRKNNYFVRGRTEISQDIEILLKVLCHNLTIIGKFMASL